MYVGMYVYTYIHTNISKEEMDWLSEMTKKLEFFERS